MTAEQALVALLAYFSRTKMSEPQQAIYLAKLRTLKPEQLSAACESAIDKHKYKTIPSVAELLAWGQGKEPGKATARSEKGVWPEHERRRQVAYADALRNATPADRCALVERSNARFEAIRSDQNRPVLASHFGNRLDEVLAGYGLDYRGEPIESRHRKEYEELVP